MALVGTYYDIELKPLPTQLTSAPPGHAALPSALGPRAHRLSALLSIGGPALGQRVSWARLPACWLANGFRKGTFWAVSVPELPAEWPARAV